MKVLIHALAASCEKLRARTGNPPLRMSFARSESDSSHLIGYLDFCAICGELWSLKRSGAWIQAIRLANSKQFWIPIGWIVLIDHAVQALLVVYDVLALSDRYFVLDRKSLKFNGKIYYQKFWTNTSHAC
jgi:hypothetical protein